MKYLKIEYLNVSDLIPYENNSRKHSEYQLKQLEKSIKENGFTNPLLVDEGNNILAGHGRLLAAQGLGMSTVPCVRIVGLSELQKRAYIIADNKLALNADWDEELLRQEFSALEAEGFDLELTGFEQEEIKRLFNSDGLDMDADLADAEENPVQSKNEYPVYISLSKKEYERWKIVRGSDSDTQAFLRIMNAFN